jgi:hypothetical protein
LPALVGKNYNRARKGPVFSFARKGAFSFAGSAFLATARNG